MINYHKWLAFICFGFINSVAAMEYSMLPESEETKEPLVLCLPVGSQSSFILPNRSCRTTKNSNLEQLNSLEQQKISYVELIKKYTGQVTAELLKPEVAAFLALIAIGRFTVVPNKGDISAFYYVLTLPAISLLGKNIVERCVKMIGKNAFIAAVGAIITQGSKTPFINTTAAGFLSSAACVCFLHKIATDFLSSKDKKEIASVNKSSSTVKNTLTNRVDNSKNGKAVSCCSHGN